MNLPLLLYPLYNLFLCSLSIHPFRGPKLERYAAKMRDFLPMTSWFLLLYLICVLRQSALLNETVTL